VSLQTISFKTDFPLEFKWMNSGFDTASSIALISVTALAGKGTSISNSQIILFPVFDTSFRTYMPVDNESLTCASFLFLFSKILFTSGMTLIDSSDSILMLYSYSGFPERSFFIFAKSEARRDSETINEHTGNDMPIDPAPKSENVSDDKSGNAKNDLQLEDRRDDDEKNGLPEEPERLDTAQSVAPQGHASDSAMERDIRVKMNMMSGLSIILTLMSILVAFRYDYLLV
jgi:high-affinity nickel-transport protein